MGISYIIPMYNAEKYIIKCVHSILNQALTEFEIIIVDDGSTDHSLAVVEKHFKDNEHIHIYHQKNAGVSAARNLGMSKACYEFITFVDADDTLEKEAFSILNKEIGESDLIISNYNIVNESQLEFNDKTKCIDGIYSIEVFTKNFYDFYDVQLVNSNWNKIYKKSLIEKYQVAFDSRLKMGEDLSFNLDYLKHCTKITVKGDKLYNYYIHENQTTQRVHFNLYDDVKIYYQKMKAYFRNLNLFSQLEKDYYYHLYDEIMWSIINVCKDKKSLRSKRKKIKEIYHDSFFKDVLNHYEDHSIKYKLIKTKIPMLILIPYVIKYGR